MLAGQPCLSDALDYRSDTGLTDPLGMVYLPGMWQCGERPRLFAMRTLVRCISGRFKSGRRAVMAGQQVRAVVPQWVRQAWRERGLCECCGQRPAESAWAGTGQLACWPCIEVKREAGMG